ncbi:MAG: hypothetical protein FJ117_12085 [Deltaproteobacteria bacterium]|nr:hypothetical protein [Deltaproteobacteria bacterium]
MRKKCIVGLALFTIPILVFLTTGGAQAQAFPPLKAGDEAPSFQLPSSQDRLVDYYRDYYGKHHLIITFFPAAFTPV